MPAPNRLYTVEDVRALPDDFNRYETIAGELFVTPAPSLRHQVVLGRQYLVLGAYIQLHDLGWLFFAPTDIVFGPLTLVEPDLVFVARSRRDVLAEREITGAPDLVVEALSPSTAKTDRGRKRALYQEQGVREYWIVDAQENRVEIWRPGATVPEVCPTTLTWSPAADVAPLAIDLADIFKPI
jgi:Uma2 family endonuclease